MNNISIIARNHKTSKRSILIDKSLQVPIKITLRDPLRRAVEWLLENRWLICPQIFWKS